MGKRKIQLRGNNPGLSELEDYRPPPLTITTAINRNHIPFALLITLIHELAHLVYFERSGPRVVPHGIEWKRDFQSISLPILQQNLLPHDVHLALNRHARNPSANSGTDAKFGKDPKKIRYRLRTMLQRKRRHKSDVEISY